jgi:selenocysteine lyase/cysteine desulfurase
MPVARRWAYFDHAAVAPLPRPAAEAVGTWCRESAEEGDTVWPRWAERAEQTRQTAARLIGADADEIALIPNTTAGITLVAEGVDWRQGDNVVTLADEFPSNAYPWLNLASRGVETRRVPTENGRPDLDQLADACDGRTRLITISWVGYSTGYRQDIDQIAALAHKRGALFFVDAIQGIGALPLDVGRTPIDFLAADGHKWMLGPEGAGFAYIRREHLDRLRPLGVGWHSVVHAHDFSHIELVLKPTAARYEGGSQNMVGMIGLGASLKLLEQTGIESVAASILEITDFACESLEAIGAEIVSHRQLESSGHDPRSGIVTFDLPGKDPMAVRQKCLDGGIALACRAGRLRLSPHAYNNEEEVGRLISVLRST